tara:strand:- start:236 stop:430 length:195 start_codon:yes stop_codon:yes gene_type:complete
MREGVFKESVIIGGVTFLIGSALMLIPIKGLWFAYLGTFLVGFFAHYLFEVMGLNESFCKEVVS